MPRKIVAMRPDAADALAVLGQQIRSARIARGWTVVDTAGRLGVSAPTYAAIERGVGGTSIGTVFNAASVLGVRLFASEDPVEIARLRRSGERDMGLVTRRVRPKRITKGVTVDGFPQ